MWCYPNFCRACLKSDSNPYEPGLHGMPFLYAWCTAQWIPPCEGKEAQVQAKLRDQLADLESVYICPSAGLLFDRPLFSLQLFECAGLRGVKAHRGSG
jgi:hypothetical protein